MAAPSISRMMTAGGTRVLRAAPRTVCMSIISLRVSTYSRGALSLGAASSARPPSAHSSRCRRPAMPTRVAPNTTAKSIRPSRKLLSPKKRTACTHTSLPRARAARIIPTGRRGERSIRLGSPARMSFVWSTLIVVLVSGLAAGTLLLVRRRAPAGSVFEDGDRASGVFGVIATGFSVLLGLIVFLAFTSYDQSRTGAESEARLIVQQYETTQFMPVAVRGELGGELVCYARSVVHQEWPRMEAGEQLEGFNVWGGAIFRTLKRVDPRTVVEQTAYDKYLDRMADREQARADRTHGAVGVIPGPLWVTLFFIAAVLFGFVLFFADSGERWYAQAALMFSVIAVIVATMLLIYVLDDPVRGGFGGLKPVAMERTLRVLGKDRVFVGDRSPLPCDARGVALELRDPR